MAARRERAVRVDPGAASDRRAPAGEGGRAVVRPLPNGRLQFVPLEALPQDRGALEPALELESEPIAGGVREDVYSAVNDLEHYRGTLQILLFLYREGPSTAYRMRQRLKPGPEAIRNCLNHLTRAGLVRPMRSETFPFGRSYELTERGNEVVLSPLQSWPYVLVK